MNSMEWRKWVSEHLRIGQEVLYLSMGDCKSTGLTEKEIFDLTEQALQAHGRKEVEMPAKIGIHPQKDSLMHAMPAYIPSEFACGIKWGANFPTNQQRFPELVPTNCLLIFNDHESGLPLAIMDAYWITEVRTPAVSFVAAKHLANLETTTFGMIGCGIQGKAHVRMVESVLTNLKTIYVYDVVDAAMDRLIRECQPSTHAEIRKTRGFEEVTKSSMVVATATPITEKPEPKVQDDWISKGQTLLLCDCHSLIDDATVKRADKYVVDSREQHELLIGYGYYPWGLPAIYAETGEVAAGLKKGRETEDELIVVNNVGMAVEDMMVARSILDRALQKGLGVKLPLWDKTH
jgi:ornithine cyclodeaminase/alanine dehydrogenase